MFKIPLSILLISSVCWAVTVQSAEDIAISVPHLHTRVLAASCAACHGTQGNAVSGTSQERNAILVGKDPGDFAKKMLGFKDGSLKATVMHHHAKGLTEAEIEQLALFFSQQPPKKAEPLISQTLKAHHE